MLLQWELSTTKKCAKFSLTIFLSNSSFWGRSGRDFLKQHETAIKCRRTTLFYVLLDLKIRQSGQTTHPQLGAPAHYVARVMFFTRLTQKRPATLQGLILVGQPQSKWGYLEQTDWLALHWSWALKYTRGWIQNFSSTLSRFTTVGFCLKITWSQGSKARCNAAASTWRWLTQLQWSHVAHANNRHFFG